MNRNDPRLKVVDVDGIKHSLNVSDEAYVANTKASIRRQLPQICGHKEQDEPIALVGGGPSLADTFDDLQEKHANGMKVVSMNGTHDWLMERGIRPSAHVQLDARPHNARFVKNWHPDTRYLIASQSHPDTFDALEGANVMQFHCFTDNKKHEKTLLDYYMGNVMFINGGSTVMSRAIPLMHTLCFKRQEIYGFDSCVMGGEHHAYEQEENDEHPYTTVTLDGKEFICDGWMLHQAKGFIGFIKYAGQDIELIVHGDGLIAHIINTGAKRLEEK